MTASAPEGASRPVDEAHLLSDVKDYWTARSAGYSMRTMEELEGEGGRFWSARLQKLLPAPASAEGEPRTLLDCGCGPAALAILAARLGWKASGCDLSPGMLEEAARNARAAGVVLELREADVQALPYASASFDAVVSRNLLWNVPEPEKALAEWLRILKPGGVLLIADGRHYRYLSDPAYARLQEIRAPIAAHQAKYMRDVDPKRMEDVAKSLPLSGADRPDWDVAALSRLGALHAEAAESFYTEAVDPETGKTVRMLTDFIVRAEKAR